MKIGDVEIQLIEDGLARTDGGGMFGLVPKVMWEKKHPADELNRVVMRMKSLLIRDGEHTMVVDTGYGSKLSPRTRAIMGIEETGLLPRKLSDQGVRTEQVDLVINTHLHADHCGGNTVEGGDRIVPTFAGATYVVQRGEWEAAMNPNERTRATYLPENFLPVQEAGRLELIEGDTQVTPSVRCVLTPGHDSSHQSVLIESEGQKAFFIADLAPYAIHIERLPWIPAYDLDPMGTIETRRRIREWAISEHVLLIFPHDPEIGMGYLHNDSGHYWIEAIG